MSVYNFFRDLFGIRRNDQQQTPNYEFEEHWRDRDDFRNPIWQTGEDDDEDVEDFRQPGHGDFGFGHFSVHSDPFEVARYFENQMNHMMKNFFGFSHDNMMPPFGEGMEDHFQDSLPSIEPPKQGNLRDEVLKPESEIAPSSKRLQVPEEEKVDLDLDGKITSNELSKVWRDPGLLESRDDSQSKRDRRNPFSFHSFGQSISIRVIRKPDGTVEQHRTVRDSDGNEETTVTQQIGDKSRTVVIKKDKNGRTTETETADPVVPMIEPNPVRPFLGITLDDGNREERNSNPLRDFPWHKFFDPSPKL